MTLLFNIRRCGFRSSIPVSLGVGIVFGDRIHITSKRGAIYGGAISIGLIFAVFRIGVGMEREIL